MTHDDGGAISILHHIPWQASDLGRLPRSQDAKASGYLPCIDIPEHTEYIVVTSRCSWLDSGTAKPQEDADRAFLREVSIVAVKVL